MTAENRLKNLIIQFAQNFELPCKPDPNQPWVDIGFSDDNDLNFVGFAFDPDEDFYEFVSAVGTAPLVCIPQLSNALLMSDPIRGITERIDESGKIVVIGGKDSLKSLTDTEIMSSFIDDLARVAQSKEQIVQLLNGFASAAS
jgi:hypothetical protein